MIEVRARKLGLVEPRCTKNRTGEVEPGQVEIGQSLPGEIGRRGGGGRNRCFDLSSSHFSRDHVWRRQIYPAHHILRGCGYGEETNTDHRTYQNTLHRWLLRPKL